jgi:hypothetical protein
MVLRLMACSPRRRIHLATVIGGLRVVRPGRADFASADLTPATGARTTRFCRPRSAFAKASADKARRNLLRKRKQRRSSARRLIAHRLTPALRLSRTPDAAASTASHHTSVTIAIRPSGGRDGGNYKVDLGEARNGIFLRRGLDGANQIERPRKIRFCAHVIWPAQRPRPEKRGAKAVAGPPSRWRDRRPW